MTPAQKQPRTPTPRHEIRVQYQTRNLWRSLLDRMRVVAAMRPEVYPTLESVLNHALDRGLRDIEADEKLPSPRRRTA